LQEARPSEIIALIHTFIQHNTEATMRAMLSRLFSQTVSSPTLRSVRRGFEAARRVLRGQRPQVLYFHQIDDPYSQLTAQVLPALLDRYDVDVVPYLVPPPSHAAAPEAERLATYSRKDAVLLASVHGLSFASTSAPNPDAVAAVANHLAKLTSPRAFAAAAVEFGKSLWSGALILPAPGDGPAAIAKGGALREQLGHYLGATFYFEGEWYWGLDRLHYLESRLASFLDKTKGPVVKALEASDAVVPGSGGAIDFFLSFRSPYTYLAAQRVQALAERRGATVRLRFVLPMVMRGLPVPNAKRLYIMRDAKREAERLGIPFGRVVDPVGKGVERGYAVLHHAIACGRGPEFIESFFRGAFAEGVDVTEDEALTKLTERAGISAAQVHTALADSSWQPVAEENRTALLDLGLWGVPSFHIEGYEAHWGQDRLWAVERDLASKTPSIHQPRERTN
jgi:2-hydroxychromene-2-carboxylate isomerase